jgi:transposase
VRISSLAKIMIGIENIVVKDVSFDEDARAIRPYRPHSCRCGKCEQKAPYHDAGRGTRRWRCPDVVGTKVYIQADAFRVRCPKCDTTVRKVPWADYGSWQLVPLRTAAAGLCCR